VSGPLRAPAKVNLGLRVVGRRPDGYHLLESLFVPLELADELRVEVRRDAPAQVQLQLRDPSAQLAHDPDLESNLATRAARAFLEAAGREAAVEIHLEKRIPAGAGLGGGSSDAGAVLRALHAAFPTALSAPELADLALRLGADVPFFLDPRPSWVGGIGEEIEALAEFPSLVLLVATPSPALSTAAVFRRFAELRPELTPQPPRRRIRASRKERTAALIAALTGERAASMHTENNPLRNDLEAAAVTLRPDIARLRETMLLAGALTAAMSGSGPSVYGVFQDRAGAEVARSRAEWESGVELHVSGTLH
jgi:4-diphosphocytidyl-2-C-methyl-D-erythritol kinase